MRRRTTLVFRVPVLAQERALHHGENIGRGAVLFLVNLQERNDLREGAQFEGGHLGFQFGFAKDRLIDFLLSLARGDGLGDRQPALGHLVVDRGGFLLRLVHGRLNVFLLVVTELERFGHAVEPRATTEGDPGRNVPAAAAPTTTTALGKHQRRRQESRQQNSTQHLTASPRPCPGRLCRGLLRPPCRRRRTFLPSVQTSAALWPAGWA